MYSILYMKWMHDQMEGGQIFHFRSIAQDDARIGCVNAIALAIAAENASSSESSVRRITVPAKVPRYLPE